PPVVDPDVGYLPDQYDGGGPQPAVTGIQDFDGFAMTMLRGVASASRLQFRSTTLEFWKDWCQAQTSYPIPGFPGVHSCLPSFNGTASGSTCTMTLADETQQPVDCGKFSLCSLIIRPCACTANGC